MLSTLLVVSCLAAAPNADEAYARTRFDDGTAAYDVGHFDAAIVAFEDAWAHAHDPQILFQLARAHGQKGDARKAAFFYERYLEAAPVTPDERARVEALIAEARASLPPPPASTTSTAPTRTARAAEVHEAPQHVEEDSPVPWLWLGVGAGVVVAGAAVALTVATATGAPAAPDEKLAVDWSQP